MDAKGRRVNSPVTGSSHYAKKNPSRLARGERAGLAKLTERDVRAIRASTETQVAIAKQFGVTQAAVSCIRLRQTWAHVA